MRVDLSAEALAQVEDIDGWWRQSRPAAPDLFLQELEQALADLGSMPSLGTPYGPGESSVRRVLLRRSHYHVYFVRQGHRIAVVAVWSCFRGRGPDL